MKRFNFYLFATVTMCLLGPFFIIGATLGQFIGAIYYGYKSGRTSFLELSKYLQRGTK